MNGKNAVQAGLVVLLRVVLFVDDLVDVLACVSVRKRAVPTLFIRRVKLLIELTRVLLSKVGQFAVLHLTL